MFKVVKIVDEYMIVVNYGKKNNAEIGDILEVFQIGEKVFDPDSNDFLGTLDVVKGRVKVINVYEKMSLCKSNEFYNSNISTIGSLLANSFNQSQMKALSVNTKQITGGYNEGDRGIINISDPVKILKANYILNNDENEFIEEETND